MTLSTAGPREASRIREETEAVPITSFDVGTRLGIDAVAFSEAPFTSITIGSTSAPVVA
jgi:hypothetical protein